MLRYSLLIVCILCCSCYTALAKNSYDVLMQESPPGSGVIKPGIGMHTFNASENITLTTAPKAGYHFVGWLGDVHDATANRTSMIVDGPKIIIAVFERDEYAFEEENPQISVGPEALFPRSDSYTNSNSVGDADTDSDDDDDDYIPDDSDDSDDPVPVPNVPEPATILLLGIGGWLAAKHRKH